MSAGVGYISYCIKYQPRLLRGSQSRTQNFPKNLSNAFCTMAGVCSAARAFVQYLQMFSVMGEKGRSGNDMKKGHAARPGVPRRFISDPKQMRSASELASPGCFSSSCSGSGWDPVSVRGTAPLARPMGLWIGSREAHCCLLYKGFGSVL